MTLTNTIAKVAAVAVAASLVVGVAFVAVAPRAEAAALSAAQVSSIVSLLQSFGADSTTIANVQASLNGTAPSTTTTTTTSSTSSSCGFTRDLTLGAKGADVTCLQQALIAKGYSIPAGATGLFGPQTQAAVIMWQKAAGVTPAAGYFGAKSRAAFGGSSSTTTTTTTPAGTGLTVAAGAMIPNSIAPQGAARVPFTNFTLTAGNDGDVTVNGVTVQRTGLGSDASFDGVILVDTATGAQLGNSQNFNSNHQAVVGGTFTVPRGTTRTFQIAANMAANLAARAGEVPAVSVVGVNTSASVSGALPITGAYNTINATLAVGTVTLIQSNAFASNSGQTVNIGDTGRKTTGLRLTAGSAEDITLKMVRFNQSGSVSATDLANVAVMINGTSYPLTVSSDGKYYMASLGAGVLIAKGNQVDMYVSYDVVGGNANGRTVIFDVDRNTDILAYGNTYGYGISPAVGSNAVPSSRGNITITSGSPFVYATSDLIQGASVTTISKANEVPAQNIAINVPNQPLGGFVVDLKGESVTVQSLVFTVASSSSGGCSTGSCLLTNVTLVNETGSVVAGPYDGVLVGTGATSQTVTMSSSITFPTGRHVYTLRGKVDSNVLNGTIYTVSTAPNGTGGTAWGNPRGNTSGNSVTLGQSNFTMNPMTVKAGTLTIGAASSLTSQNIVPGGQQVEMARFAFDAGQSGEDVRISSVPADLVIGGAGASTDLSSCQLYNGSTSLTTGSNTVSPTGSTPVDKIFVLDNPVTVTKGTVVTLSLKCNVSGNAANGGTFAWLPGTTGSVTGGFTVTGAVSGTTLTKVAGSNTAATFTIGTGSFTATAASAAIAQPSLVPAAAGSTGVTLGYVKFRATNEPVNLTKVGLTLANGVYGTLSRGNGGSSNSGQGDVMTVYLYNGATMVGSATFNGSQIATSTLNSALLLPKDTDTILTIKGDLAQIGVSASGGIGDTVKVDPLNAEGTGASSGSVVAISATAGVNGVQLVKSYPTVAFVSNATNPNGVNVVLKKFTITANAAGPVGVHQFKIAIATSSASVTDLKLYAYTDSGYSQGLSSQSSGTGQIGSTACTTPGCTSNSPTLTFTTATNRIQIPAGTTYYFALLGTVTPGASANNWTISPTVQGDAAAQTGLLSGTGNGYIATTTANVATSNFVWSDNATTTANTTDVDWFNGFQIPGLPGTGF